MRWNRRHCISVCFTVSIERFELIMPTGPKGQKRPADVIGNAVKVMRIATGEIEETAEDNGKDRAAVELGRKGGEARASKLSAKQRKEIAKKAANVRWSKDVK